MAETSKPHECCSSYRAPRNLRSFSESDSSEHPEYDSPSPPGRRNSRDQHSADVKKRIGSRTRSPVSQNRRRNIPSVPPELDHSSPCDQSPEAMPSARVHQGIGHRNSLLFTDKISEEPVAAGLPTRDDRYSDQAASSSSRPAPGSRPAVPTIEIEIDKWRMMEAKINELSEDRDRMKELDAEWKRDRNRLWKTVEDMERMLMVIYQMLNHSVREKLSTPNDESQHLVGGISLRLEELLRTQSCRQGWLESRPPPQTPQDEIDFNNKPDLQDFFAQCGEIANRYARRNVHPHHHQDYDGHYPRKPGSPRSRRQRPGEYASSSDSRELNNSSSSRKPQVQGDAKPKHSPGARHDGIEVHTDHSDGIPDSPCQESIRKSIHRRRSLASMRCQQHPIIQHSHRGGRHSPSSTDDNSVAELVPDEHSESDNQPFGAVTPSTPGPNIFQPPQSLSSYRSS